MAGVFPRRNLPRDAEAWGRHVQNDLEGLDSRVSQQAQITNNALRANSGQLDVLSGQISTLLNTVDTLGVQINRLNNAGQVWEDSNGEDHSGTGWRTGRPSVSARSLSGKFLVTVFGTAAGTTTYFTYQAPGSPRTRAIGATTSARVERVSGLGGASSEATVMGQWVYTGAADSPVTFTGEAYGTTVNSASTAVKIIVQPIL